MSVDRQSTRVTLVNHGCKPQRRGKSNRNHVRNCRDHTLQGSPLKSLKGCVRLGVRSGRRNFLSCNRLPRIFNSLHMDISRLLLNESRNFLCFEETHYTSEVKKKQRFDCLPIKRKLLCSGARYKRTKANRNETMQAVFVRE